jgi:hypothetical protein
MAKITISPGQGLLLLIDHYKDDPLKVAQLKKLYLSGAENPVATEEIHELLGDKILSGYDVLYDAKTINEDPTRRYFETHLAYETLTNGLGKIKVEDLRTHLDAVIKKLPQGGDVGEFFIEYVSPILEGEYRKHDPAVEIEFASYIAKLKEGKMFNALPPEDKEKMELLIKSAFVAILVLEFAEFPLDIYGSDDYAKENRGKILNNEQKTTRNLHLGLMKGHMPLPRDDIARSEKVTPYLKPSDQAAFAPDAAWVKSNFSKLVHPFSNSISGTMLAQLRVIAKLRDEGMPGFTESGEKLALFNQLFTSTLLFGSGGHTLHEFTAPIMLPAAQAEFSSTPGAESITLESMYLTHNETSFDTALQDAINYNKMILLREGLHADVKAHRPSSRMSASIEQLESKMAQQKVTQSMLAERELFAPRIQKYNFRADIGTRKNEMIKESLDEAISFIQKGDLSSAQEKITSLKERFTSEFGTTNFLGMRSDSYKLILSLEKHLATYQKAHHTVAFKSHITELKNPLVEPLEEERAKKPP